VQQKRELILCFGEPVLFRRKELHEVKERKAYDNVRNRRIATLFLLFATLFLLSVPTFPFSR